MKSHAITKIGRSDVRVVVDRSRACACAQGTSCYDGRVGTSSTDGDATRWEDADDPRYESLRPVHARSLERARTRLREERSPASGRGVGTCGATLARDSRLGRRGERCRNAAGLYGAYEDERIGPCWAHGGALLRGRSEAAWVMAHQFAAEYDVTPWEGLLKAVRIAAGKVAYTEWVLSQASDDLELEGRFARNDDGILLHPDTGEMLGAGQLRDLSWWVRKNELWVDRLARYSKAAIDAGVAERLVEIERTNAEGIAHVLNGVLSALESEAGYDDEALAVVRGLMRRQLTAMDSEPRSAVIEGEVAR